MFDIQEELKRLPQSPGVYLMKNSHEEIIYVGKAINLKNRVRSYFQASAQENSLKLKNMVPQIKSFEYIVASNEAEALILEANLIKANQPRYNILLKDDKAYPYIKLTINEMYPRIFATRQNDNDKAKYFGPYSGMFYVVETLELIHRIWPLRRCTKKLPGGQGTDRTCLNYHIGKCMAPCVGKINESDYSKMVSEITEFLNGNYGHILKSLEKEMYEHSENLEFEKAADIRDKINAVKKLNVKQTVDVGSGDQDIVAFAKKLDEALVQVFFIRGGKMLGREHFILNGVSEMTDSEIMTAFVTQFYGGTPFVPKELLLQTEINDVNLITEWLSNERGKKVSISVPRKGDKFKLVELAANNASLTMERFGEEMKREKQRTEGALNEIAKAVGLDMYFERIEAYDISNTQGFESVGSMVVFENGKPKRSDYRKFKIKGVAGANDYASMEEVISRRFTRYLKEMEDIRQKGSSDNKFGKLPDVIFIDGGKGQVHAAEAVLEKLGLSSLPVCGMVKDDRHRTRGLMYKDNETVLPASSEGFKLVTRIQDEVHRFAIEYHRKLREKGQIRSLLDEINGIGDMRRKALMKHFGDISKIRRASIEQLTEVTGMTAKSAKAVYDFFHSV